MAVFPSEAVALAFPDLAAASAHYSIDRTAWDAFSVQVGQPDLRIFAAMPAEENCMRTRVPPLSESLTPTQAVQVGLIWRLSKRMHGAEAGGNWDAWIDEDPWIPRQPTTTTPAATPGDTNRQGAGHQDEQHHRPGR